MMFPSCCCLNTSINQVITLYMATIFNRMLGRMLLKDERIFRLVKEGSLPGYKVYRVNQQKLQQKLHGGNMHVLPK